MPPVHVAFGQISPECAPSCGTYIAHQLVPLAVTAVQVCTTCGLSNVREARARLLSDLLHLKCRPVHPCAALRIPKTPRHAFLRLICAHNGLTRTWRASLAGTQCKQPGSLSLARSLLHIPHSPYAPTSLTEDVNARFSCPTIACETSRYCAALSALLPSVEFSGTHPRFPKQEKGASPHLPQIMCNPVALNHAASPFVQRVIPIYGGKPQLAAWGGCGLLSAALLFITRAGHQAAPWWA